MRKNKLAKVVAAVMAGILFAVAAPGETANAQLADGTIVYTALGDSITDANAYTGKSWTSYPKYIQDDMDDAGMVKFKTHNDGVNGYKTSDVLNLIKTDKKVIADLKESDVISLFIGSNDLMHAPYNALGDAGYIKNWWPIELKINSKEDAERIGKIVNDIYTNPNNKYYKEYVKPIRSNLFAIMDTIRKYNPNAPIFLATAYNNDEGLEYLATGFTGDESISKVFLKAYKSLVVDMQGYFKEAVSTYPNTFYVDMDWLGAKKYYQQDSKGNFLDIHPTYEGQKKIATTFELAFNDAMSKLRKVEGSPFKDYACIPYNNDAYAASNVSYNPKNRCIDMTVTKDKGARITILDTPSASNNSFAYKAAKSKGAVNGFSISDSSNKTEIAAYFTGSDTKSIWFTVGGQKGFLEEKFKLGFDASKDFHKYSFGIKGDIVSLYADGKLVHSFDASKIAHPSFKSSLQGFAYIELLSWLPEKYDGNSYVASLRLK